jgi:ABC-type transport system substrate-binding protein
MPDPTTASAALQAGEVDPIEQPLIDLLPLMRHNQSLRVTTNNSFGAIGVIVFNHLRLVRLANQPAPGRAARGWLNPPDIQAQRRIADDIQRLVWDEVRYIPVGQWSLPIAYRATVTGILRSPYTTFWHVSKS